MVFFTADLHFGHENIIRHCNRPFSSADEMDAALIRNWNATVGPRDEVYILGDLTMQPASKAHEYLEALKGRKFFIRGNHDRFLDGFEPYKHDLAWVKDYHVLKYAGRKIVLFHYPIAEWDGFFRDSIHLYGHIHNSAASTARLPGGLAFNVGVDCWGFRPISADQILTLAAEKEKGVHDEQLE